MMPKTSSGDPAKLKYFYGFLLCLLRHSWHGNIRELLRVLKDVPAGAWSSQAVTIDHLQLFDESERVAIQQLPEEVAERESYRVLDDGTEAQGLARGKGLYRRMAQILGVSEFTMSRWLKGVLLDVPPEATESE